MRRQGARAGIIFPLLLSGVILFIVLMAFLVFTPMLSGFLNGAANIAVTFGSFVSNPVLSMEQGMFLIFESAMVIIAITAVVFLVFSAHRDEGVE